eukprot:TRINITY_DN30204_c0_g1_i1.p1 TRINITY_DN30204_c0_g1~~TRINITY_DN30204_c0_g1_i1.p1  ORF type:complete len:545 (+),score=105.38 TRINITY_DN30204_c0_g1_i1:51-1685(+)
MGSTCSAGISADVGGEIIENLPDTPGVRFTAFQDAPNKQPEQPGLLDSCLITLPENACRILGLRPNIEDKGFGKKLWFGRVWQLRALQLKQYRDLLSKHPQTLSEDARKSLDQAMEDPKTKELLLKVQRRWRGAVCRGRMRLGILNALSHDPCAHFGTVLFMHGSGGMTYNNIRYARKLAGMGYLVIAPDSMAGGEYRKKDLSKPIIPADETPYWGDLGIYSSDAQGEYTYSTEAKAVVDDPERFRTLYANVFRMRRDEMHWILGRLPLYIQKTGVFLMGQSEGAMTVARFDDQRYGAMIRGRIVSAFSVEYCYFTPTPEAGKFGGNPEVPTLNIIGDADQYFGNIDSVALSVSKMKDQGGYGADVITGNAFKTMQTQKLRRGLVTVLEGAKHDASETHDNILRDLLRSFLAAPADCHRLPDLWKIDPYLAKKVQVLQRDMELPGERVLVKIAGTDFPSTLPFYRESLFRQANHLKPLDARRKRELEGAQSEKAVIVDKANDKAALFLNKYRTGGVPLKAEEVKTTTAYDLAVKDMPRKTDKKK